MNRALAWEKRSPGQGGILYFDLDGLKQANSELGHAGGDRLIMAAAQQLAGSVRTCDLVARIGGDEFVVLLHGEQKDIVGVGLNVQRRLAEHNVEASLGTTTFPLDSSDCAEDVLARADAAMYRDKAVRSVAELATKAAALLSLNHALRSGEVLQPLQKQMVDEWHDNR